MAGSDIPLKGRSRAGKSGYFDLENLRDQRMIDATSTRNCRIENKIRNCC